MKVNRKIFAILIAIAIIAVSVISVSAYPAYDVSEEIRSGDYDYYILSDDTVRLSAYYGADENLIIPEIIDGHNISAIGRGGAQWFFNNLDPDGNDFRKVKSIELPKTLTWFLYNSPTSCFGNWSNIENIYVDEENPNFKSDNGIFYNKDMSKLLFYPEGKKDLEYTVPESVTAIEYASFDSNRYVERICLGKQISYIDDNNFSNCPNLTLYVYDNSYGLEWAKNHDFTYEIIEEKEDIITNDENGIPDTNLYNALLQKADTNEDGILTIDEAEAIEIIDVSGNEISSLIGIKYFKKIKALYVAYNNLTTLEGLEGLPKLYWLDVHCNKLTNIDNILNFSNIMTICAWDNNLSTLPDLKNFENIQVIGNFGTDFSYNKLSRKEMINKLPAHLLEAEHYYNHPKPNIDVWLETQTPDPENMDLADTDTGIKATGLMHPDATLNVESVENTVQNAFSTFDITLTKYGDIIQPDGEITILIPSEYNDCDVFWVKDDGTKVNMNAEYIDGKYVFTTDHLSVYALVRKSATLLGDVNGDGKVGIDDATDIQKYMAEMLDFTDKQKELADVNKDGKVGVDDVTLIQKHMAGLAIIE